MSGAISVVSEWVMWAVGGIVAVVAPVGGVVKRNRDRSIENKRQLQGDPNDPNTEGVLAIAFETREELHEFRREARRSHEELMEKVDE